MLEFDEKSGRLVWKIVYYGPALSGKTTNLLRLHDRLTPAKRGEMMQLDTREDRTLFFDLLPLAYRTAAGATLKIKLFTVPGQVQYNATRKSVLMRADGVVFVADSQRSQALHNSESFRNLEENARHVGLHFDTLPLVIQFNKRDLPKEVIVSEEEVLSKWRGAGIPVLFSSALYGHGVVETFEAILRQVCRYMEEKHHVRDKFGIVEGELVSYLLEGEEKLQGAVF